MYPSFLHSNPSSRSAVALWFPWQLSSNFSGRARLPPRIILRVHLLPPPLPLPFLTSPSRKMRFALGYLSRALSWSILPFQPHDTPQRATFIESNGLALPRQIPGGSPLNYCNESSKADLYQIEHIELYPNPLYV